MDLWGGLSGAMRPRVILWLALLLAGAALLLLVVPLWPQIRVAGLTLLFLPHLFPEASIRPLELITPPPLRQELSLLGPATLVPAELYRPGAPGPPMPGVILVLGVNPLPRGDPTVVRMAEGLARLGLVVLIPESPDLLKGRILPRETDNLVAAFRFLRGLRFVDGSRVGYGGFRVGASLATVAAADPRINREVAYLHSFGGYYDALDLTRAIVSRSLRYSGLEAPWQPQEMTLEVFRNHLIELLERPGEPALLRQLLAQGARPDPAGLAALSPEGRLVLRLLTEKDPPQAEALVPQLPPSLSARLRALSPSAHLENLRARLFILHDRGDSYIPYVESRRLVAALPERVDYLYTELALFRDTGPGRPGDLITLIRELSGLYRHLFILLQYLLA